MERRRFCVIAVITGMAVLFSTLIWGIYSIYNIYITTLIRQQQQQLLDISRSVSTSLNLAISEQLSDIAILTGTPGFAEETYNYYSTGQTVGLKRFLLAYMTNQQHELSKIYLFDRNCKEIFEYRQYPYSNQTDNFSIDFDALVKRGISGIGTVFAIAPHHYEMALVNSIYINDCYMGAVIGIVDLQTLYEQYVSPAERLGQGYLVVQDDNGKILMHPQVQRIGQTPEELGEDRNNSFSQLMSMEQEYEVGTATYWMDEDNLGIAGEKIAAFSHMNVGDTSWSVMAVLPSEDAMEPAKQNLGRFAALVLALFLLFALFILQTYRMEKKHQRLKIRADYLKNLNHTLQELQESREQVRHYQKMQSIGSLAGGVAHEFNNLLTPILGYSELILNAINKESELYDDVYQIYGAGMRAKEIVKQLLPFYRREKGGNAYSLVSLDGVLSDAIKTISVVLPKNVQLQTNLHKTTANIFGNATQLNQVLLNLCTNAIQSMEPDGGILTVENRLISADQLPESACPLNQCGKYAEIQVRDTGCGISPEILSKIFEPFFTTKKHGQGTGMGLSVVRDILVDHGGSISVESNVGKGSLFTVYLPVAQQIEQLPMKAITPIQSKAEDKDTFQFLVLESDKKILNLLKKQLSRGGWNAEFYKTPEQALKRFRENPDLFDLAIVEYQLQNCRGIKFAEQLKMLRCSMPVILITGLPDDAVFQMQEKKILDEILIKPFTYTDLAQQVYKLLS
ncbi:MAG: Stage 0 sporulation A-like protein [Oscillospiraceae bacterium]